MIIIVIIIIIMMIIRIYIYIYVYLKFPSISLTFGHILVYPFIFPKPWGLFCEFRKLGLMF